MAHTPAQALAQTRKLAAADRDKRKKAADAAYDKRVKAAKKAAAAAKAREKKANAKKRATAKKKPTGKKARVLAKAKKMVRDWDYSDLDAALKQADWDEERGADSIKQLSPKFLEERRQANILGKLRKWGGLKPGTPVPTKRQLDAMAKHYKRMLPTGNSQEFQSALRNAREVAHIHRNGGFILIDGFWTARDPKLRDRD